MERRQIVPQPYHLFLATAAEGKKTIIVRRVVAWQATAGSVHGDDLVPLVITRGKVSASVVPEMQGTLHTYGETADEAQRSLSKLLESQERYA